MRVFANFVLSLLFIGSLALYGPSSKVIKLTAANFDSQVIRSNQLWFVEFYAPWCGHCKKLAPEYAKAAKTLKALQPPIPLAKVDATVEKALKERFELKTYPMIRFFMNGKSVEYNRSRTANEIVNWVKRRTLPPSIELKTVNEAEKFIADSQVAVILFGGEGTSAYETYVTEARIFDDISFGHTSSVDIASKYGVDLSAPRVVLFKKFDEGRADFTGPLETEDLRNFLDINEVPIVQPFTTKTVKKIFSNNNPALILFREDDTASKNAEAALRQAAERIQRKIIISVSGVRDPLGKHLADYVTIAEADIPTIRIIDPAHEELHKFILEGDINANSIVKFYEDWASKLLKPHYRSEEIPETNNEPVKVVVGKSFKDFVMDERRDVLVEFYAPWCNHCKRLAPTYEAVAKRVSHIQNLVIAKIDASANEIEGQRVAGFPTIKFYPANNKLNPIDFKGERTEEGFVKFLKEHMTVEWVESNEKHQEL
eukprot:TRINITY_DN4878_c0_g5_i1.p1 TRINITY_DN4878_c0_g5~~TRINITY_DN4878_c0_g5_i1.p1  ORF type:complete len:485 (-),score=132.86 TRINITY_DN4878_c0_g5_i1:42-1496(-)